MASVARLCLSPSISAKHYVKEPPWPSFSAQLNFLGRYTEMTLSPHKYTETQLGPLTCPYDNFSCPVICSGRKVVLYFRSVRCADLQLVDKGQ